ncbi:MAG: hypothetical protein OXU77_17000 [Gammaproteobacteria bacterium]|nr:hypothetical protein [Gammaproteobacteria bacterium]
MTTHRAGFLAVAAAEFRGARRLSRTWLLGFLVVAGGSFLYLGGSGVPRFALPGVGMLLLSVLLIVVVFLAFDIRARDERERIAEVLDARSIPNVVLLGGRLLGIAFIAWLPLAIWALLLQGIGMLDEAVNLSGSRISDSRVTPEPASLVTFVFLDAPPALVAWGALVMFLAAALGNRLVACLVALALLSGAFWALFNTPLYLLPAVSGIANLGLPGSEILPRMPSLVEVAQRLASLVLAVGLVTIAAALFPRRDSASRLPYVAWGAAFLLASGTGFAGLVVHVHGERAERVAWADAHRAIQQSPRPNLERVAGTVGIDPGREVMIAVDLDFRVTREGVATDLLFSLNPSMRLKSVRLNGSDTPFEHRLGILAIHPTKALPPGTRATLSIRAQGIPDPRFGYLDSSVWALDETLLGMPLVLQGERASIFDRRYVALTPAVRWLPMPGANFGNDNPAVHPPDFHRIDLVVKVPDGWHAAGPGRMLDSPELRFRPSVPLAEFPLITAPFERRSLTVDGVQYELLVHPMHLAGVEHFAAEGNLEGTLEHLRTRLAMIPGLPYPHRVHSLAEVPAQLRRYGGGRFMDTVQSLPGVQMLPEHGLPTTRYNARGWSAPSDVALGLDLSFAESAPHGLRVTARGARNLLTSLTSASGEGALAANYLLESLTAWRWRGARTVAPGHWLQPGFGPAPLPLRVMHRLLGEATFSFNWYQFFPMELEDRSAELSFTGFDPTASRDHADILIHKGDLIASAIQVLMGRDKVAEFLALMRSRHGGDTFELEDLMAAMADTDPAMSPYIEHFMRQSALPGFLASDLRIERLADDGGGQPRYQLSVHVRNDEDVPGVAGISFRVSDARALAAFERGGFSHVPGNTSLELGVVTRSPPREVRLETFLSQNRRIMLLALPEIDSDTLAAGEPFQGARPSDWMPPDLGIVVDDLDPGFSVVQPSRTSLRMDFGGDEVDRTTVTEYQGDAGARRWRRQEHADTASWGKYRRTLTRIRAGSGEGSASFRAELPTSGTWRLSYHLPGSSASKRTRSEISRFWRVADRLGTLDLEIEAAERRIPAGFNASTAVHGWNDLGRFELPAGPVTVVVSDATTGDIAVADAVRWELISPTSPGR